MTKQIWLKPLVIIFLFYFFALSQNSFFTHFNLFGAVPNLVFILFSLLVFFENKQGNLLGHIIFLAVTAGAFLDIFSYAYLGPSIVLLIIIGFLSKNTQSLLKNRGDSRPFIYFLPLFIIFLLVYSLLLGLCLYFLDSNKIAVGYPGYLLGRLGIGTIFSVIYNSLIASVLFYIYKWQKFIK